MVTTAPGTTATQPRRAYRPVQGRMVGGVARGLAEHLSVDVFWVRVALVVSSWFSGVGFVVYALLWRLLPQALDSGSRRTAARSRSDTLQTLGLVAVGVGVLLLLQHAGWGFGGPVLWPLTIAMVGVALAWRQADDAQRQRWTSESPDLPMVGVLLGTGGWAGVLRLGVGVLLVGAAGSLFVAQRSGLGTLVPVLAAVVLAVLGVALLLGPWISRLARDLAAERGERIRSQERADVAAHLHDSVLQTLAMLQRHADDPKAVARLARRQERELRDWLYAGEPAAGSSLRSVIVATAVEVEQRHDVLVEVVCVGDVDLDDATRTLASAAGEAMVNAAKHAQVDTVDVYVEVSDVSVEAFVRDRGVGFDPSAVPEDRMGVRRSILERMHRHGGTAQILSSPGAGTEVRLAVPR
jgi:signal transduction histidine kinase